MNITPISARIYEPDGVTAHTYRYCLMGKHEVWVLDGLRGRLLRRRLRESGLDKRQTRRFLRRHGKALAA